MGAEPYPGTGDAARLLASQRLLGRRVAACCLPLEDADGFLN
jgi:hypothetical protein